MAAMRAVESDESEIAWARGSLDHIERSLPGGPHPQLYAGGLPLLQRWLRIMEAGSTTEEEALDFLARTRANRARGSWAFDFWLRASHWARRNGFTPPEDP